MQSVSDESVPIQPVPIEAQVAQIKGRERWWRQGLGAALLLLVLASIAITTLDSAQARFFVSERFQTFVTIFLGIFIEAVPFLLAGSIVSGFIDVFVDRSWIERVVPRNPVLAALSGAGLGLIFPVCECGVVPVTRRLYGKGLPLAVGVAFLLAAPVINPVVIASTWTAFGWGPILWGRIGITVLIAFTVGLIFQVAKPHEILLPNLFEQRTSCAHDAPVVGSTGLRVGRAFNTAGDDFLDMSRYLIIGSMLAAAMQAMVPQSALMTIGQDSVISVFALMILAFILSVCSTVDAFLALAFSTTFTSGAVIGFLTFGPMVDVKSSLLFMTVFKRRTVGYLILLPFSLAAVIGIIWNLYLGG
jgi:uncharacterized protein